jgi:hypothetical protein
MPDANELRRLEKTALATLQRLLSDATGLPVDLSGVRVEITSRWFPMATLTGPAKVRTGAKDVTMTVKVAMHRPADERDDFWCDAQGFVAVGKEEFPVPSDIHRGALDKASVSRLRAALVA